MHKIAVISALLLGCSTSPLYAQKSDAKVKIKTSASKPDENGVQKIKLELTIEPEWYLYANPVKHEGQEAAQTTLKIQSAAALKNIKITYPEGTEKTVLGETMQVYEGTATIQATVQRPVNDANPLKLILQVNACRNMTCLPQGKIFIDVP